jgi:hypothetical protein
MFFSLKVTLEMLASFQVKHLIQSTPSFCFEGIGRRGVKAQQVKVD